MLSHHSFLLQSFPYSVDGSVKSNSRLVCQNDPAKLTSTSKPTVHLLLDLRQPYEGYMIMVVDDHVQPCIISKLKACKLGFIHNGMLLRDEPLPTIEMIEFRRLINEEEIAPLLLKSCPQDLKRFLCGL